MKYIEKIILTNFQSHEHTELDLSRGVNVIVGPSDSGKTAIMRALRWNLFNEPSGVEFVREGEKEVSVTVRFQDRVEVVRRRSKSKNQYILRIPDEEEVIFEGFGTHVPREIKEATGIHKVMLDDKKSLPLNFSDQLEGPFLLQESDAYKAQAIGRMVGVDILDETMRDTLRDKKQVSIHKELVEKECEETRQSLEMFSDLDEKIRLRDRLQALFEKMEALEELHRKAQLYQREGERVKNEKEQMRTILLSTDSLSALSDHLSELERKARRYESDTYLLDAYVKNQSGMREARHILDSLADEKALSETLQILNPAFERYRALKPYLDRYRALSKQRRMLSSLLDGVKDIASVSPEKIAALYEEVVHYRHLYGAKRELDDRLARGRDFLSRFDSLEQIDTQRRTINHSYERVRELLSLYDERMRVLSARRQQEKDLTSKVSASKDALDRYLALLDEAGRCPLCKQPITSHHLETIKHTLEEE
ncbi:MAG: AAA family ATPase [Peptoniphilus sp.]|nr:AAA family ATPase [Peptoniphilus sp.]MDD7362990.1 AAA family ATPase [Bacillota bacterium]MDY6044230.1 AAA family ATPase [Peptoniphilus sp.]